MSTKPHHIVVSNIKVEIVRKDIKNLHLGVYPPNGKVRVASPLVLSDEAIRLAVIGKLGWIKRQREAFLAQSRQSERTMMRGESHYYLGRRYRLNVVEQPGAGHIGLRSKATMDLFVRTGTTSQQREAVLQRWYRAQLKALLSEFLEKWQAVLGLHVQHWGIKQMKTKWGGCNPATARVWFNLELIKSPPACIEYLVVHELLHLLERNHNERFTALLDQHLPNWRSLKLELNQGPLRYSQWE